MYVHTSKRDEAGNIGYWFFYTEEYILIILHLILYWTELLGIAHFVIPS